jgi:hypothetical protein
MASHFLIVGQAFFFAGTCLPSCSLATAIHVTILSVHLKQRILLVSSHQTFRLKRLLVSNVLHVFYMFRPYHFPLCLSLHCFPVEHRFAVTGYSRKTKTSNTVVAMTFSSRSRGNIPPLILII